MSPQNRKGIITVFGALNALSLIINKYTWTPFRIKDWISLGNSQFSERIADWNNYMFDLNYWLYVFPYKFLIWTRIWFYFYFGLNLISSYAASVDRESKGGTFVDSLFYPISRLIYFTSCYSRLSSHWLGSISRIYIYSHSHKVLLIFTC